VGKSRLLSELGRQSLRDGVRVWSMRGTPFLRTPYLAIDALLTELARTCLCGSELEAASEAWWRRVGRADAIAEASDVGFAAGEQQRLSAAFVRALLERASHGGFLLLIDDLQWLDGPSIDLVWEALGQAVDSSRSVAACLAVVATTRGAETGTAASWVETRFGADRVADVVELSGLEEREIEAWLAAAGLDPPARALAARMHAATQGNPRRLEERLALLRERGLLAQRGRTWVATLDPVELEGEAVDPPIALEPEERRTLGVLALLAAPASVARVSKLSGACPEAVVAHLEFARGEGWLVHRDAQYAFEDVDVARSLAASLDPRERVRLHHEIAQLLEAGRESDPELAAHHWLHALPEADPARVAAALEAAGLAALRARDWRLAASHFETALARAAPTDERERARLHERAGIAHFRTLDGAAAAAHFDRAAAGFERTGDDAGVVRARVEAMRSRSVLSGAAFGFQPPDLEALEARIAALPDAERPLRVYANAMLADSQAMSRDLRRANETAQRALAELPEDRDDLACRAHAALGVVQLAGLELDAAVRSFRDALRFGRRLDDPWYEGLALQRLPLVLAWTGHMDEAASYLVASRKGAEASGDWADFTLTLGTEAGLANARGEFGAVEQLARQAVTLARRTGYVWGGALALTALATARALNGRLADALDAIALLDSPGLLADEVPPLWNAVAAMARLRVGVLGGRIAPGDRDTAAGLADVLVSSSLDVQLLTAVCACAEVAAAVGDRALLERTAGPIEEALERGIAFVPSLDDALARVCGIVAAGRGRRDEALARFREALEVPEQNGARAVEARTHLELGRLLEALGRHAEARVHSGRALALAERLGMQPVVDSLRGGRPEAGRAEATTPEDVRLLRALAQGLDGDALAQELLLTREGLERLQMRTFERIGATSRVEAMAWALREGLAGLPPALRHAGTPEPGRAPPLERASRRPLTVFVSDIAHSTALLQRVGDHDAQRLVQEHNRVVRRLLRAHQGVEIQQTGDGFIAIFDEPDPALACAIALQREIEQHALGGAATPMRLRVALHSGELLLEEGRVFGVAMHIAAHICGVADVGSVAVSQAFWDSLREPGAWRRVSLGPTGLKGLAEPIELFQIDPREPQLPRPPRRRV